jgi:hypothetical protein
VSAFSSLDVYYESDERRRRSREIDFGVWWKLGAETFRVTWVEATGELIAVRLGPGRGGRGLIKIVTHEAGPALLLGQGAVNLGGEPMEVYELAVIPDEDEVEGLLAGWAEVCDEPNSLAWIVGRCATNAFPELHPLRRA